MKFSVIVPTRNRPEVLASCLKGLAAQSVAKDFFEVIVIDDGSGSSVRERLEALAGQHPSVRFLFLPHGGPATSRNFGIAEASGEVIGFTDDDCILDPAWVETAARALEGHPDWVGVEGRTDTVPKVALYSHQTSNHAGGRYLTCNIAYRAEALRKAGGFDTHFPYPNREDSELALRMLDNGPIGFEPAMKALHTSVPIRPGWMVRRLKVARSDYYLFRKNPAGYRKLIGPHPLDVTVSDRAKATVAILGVSLAVSVFFWNFWILLAGSLAAALWVAAVHWRAGRKLGIQFVMATPALVPFVLEAIVADVFSVFLGLGYLASAGPGGGWAERSTLDSIGPSRSAPNAPIQPKGLEVSVIVPTRGRPWYVQRCAQYLADQTLAKEHFEVIFVLDGADRESREELKAFTEKLQLTVLERTTRGGPAAARQTGVEVARGRIIAFTDDDCIPEKWWLEEILRAFGANPRAVGVEGKVETPKVAQLYQHFPVGPSGRAFLTANVAFLRGELVAAGGLDPSFGIRAGSDTDLGLRMLERGVVVAAPKAIVYHPPVSVKRWFYIGAAKRSVNYFHLRDRSPSSYERVIGRGPLAASLTKRSIAIHAVLWGGILLSTWLHALIILVLLAVALPSLVLTSTLLFYRRSGVNLELQRRQVAMYTLEALVVDLIRPALVISAWSRARRWRHSPEAKRPSAAPAAPTTR